MLLRMRYRIPQAFVQESVSQQAAEVSRLQAAACAQETFGTESSSRSSELERQVQLEHAERARLEAEKAQLQVPCLLLSS